VRSHFTWFLIILFIILAGASFILTNKAKHVIIEKKQGVIHKLEKKTSMKITSTAFENNSQIPKKYTCDGENINPPLAFEDIPDTAKTLVLIVEDPDAPSKTWVHWILYNISPNVKFINEGSAPSNAKQALTDSGEPKYSGPCPPSGTHRYFFKLYALDEKLTDMPDFTDKPIIEAAMEGHIVGSAELIGLYSKE